MPPFFKLHESSFVFSVVKIWFSACTSHCLHLQRINIKDLKKNHREKKNPLWIRFATKQTLNQRVITLSLFFLG